MQPSVVVVGAGVVGLAVARSLAARGYEPLILEAETQFGTGTSARNSGVIHAGIYYASGSLKAQLCVRGLELLYDYCERNQIPHARIGKIIFAHDEAQIGNLETLAAAALANGAPDCRLVGPAEAARFEPALSCRAALLSPSTGIVDPQELMATLVGEAEANGAQLVLNTSVTAISRNGDQWDISVEGSSEPALTVDHVVNCAGLAAHRVASLIEGLEPRHVPKVRFAKGNYFAYSGPHPFRRLVYPMPEPGGLGTHLTLDLAGQARFGPDVEWIDEIDYMVDERRKERFLTAARKIWSDLDPERLQPAYCGIRPKLDDGSRFSDFLISDPAVHSLPGIINLFGLESPGLTASLAIGELVADRVAAGK